MRPSPASARTSPSLLLQRQRCDGDSRRWRTVLRVPPDRLMLAARLVEVAGAIDAGLRWRLTPDEAGESYLWEQGRWISQRR